MPTVFKLCLGFTVFAALTTTMSAAEKLQYNRDIRPILSENCFSCHGADSAARKAKLRLDKREAAIEKGAIAPGKVDASEMVERLFLKNDDEQRMPPPSSHKELTPAQKETLKRWIAEGAEYQEHWSFIAPKKPAVPTVKNAEWVKNPIDAFIVAELEKRGLTPAATADRRTLARRASLDVTGLPPTPEAVEAFVNDKSANAYEKYLDSLFASPHYGEHRGRYWLDGARYGDTHGIHFDNYREMWAYRDWVFNAFNANMPFDQFTIEQLAGDLLPNPTLDQKIATGFNRCNITTNEGGAINEEYLVLYTRDRTDTANTLWMGLTTGCAVCHDHKYDPISQKDFYSLAAFFNNSTQNAMDGNIKDTPPIIFVPSMKDRGTWQALDSRIQSTKKQLEGRKTTARKAFDEWMAKTTPASILGSTPEAGLALRAMLHGGLGTSEIYTANSESRAVKLPKNTTWKDGPFGGKVAWTTPKDNGENTLEFPKDVGHFESDKPFSYGAWVQIPQRGQTGGIIAKMDVGNSYRGWDLWLENDKFGAHIIDKWPSQAIKVTTRNGFDPNKWHHVFVTYDGSKKAAGVSLFVDGEPQPVNIHADDTQDANKACNLTTLKNDVPLTVGRRSIGQNLKALGVSDFRIYNRALTTAEVHTLSVATRVASVLAQEPGKRKPADVDETFNWWLGTTDAESKTLSRDLQNFKQEETAYRARGTVAHISVEKADKPEAYLLERGEYDRRKDKVSAGTPAALPAMPADLPRNRLGYAQWLLRAEHPLTTRVTVNRYWSEIFGIGLVRTAGDFGISGEQPSHPELLDWMAMEFRDTKWDIKRFFKMILMSNTYQQAATTTPEKLEKDPANKYLSRGPRFRMDAEMIRDYALNTSGLMVAKLGGPSVKPYQPTGVWEAVAMPGSDTRDYKQDKGENLYRRSVYTFWKRAAPPASMEIFNAPNRETCTVRRERTNTPLQALVTLNDIQFVEAARHLATNAMKAGTTTEARIDYLAKKLLSRPLLESEVKLVKASFTELEKHYASHEAEAKKLITFGESPVDASLKATELAAWTMLTNQLMNLDEVLCK
jgi:Protein of unknown function (DUF1553)/Protein of unknown function (DUF1549)/Concanavalin A-like lectin/glucanases superfamily/Planctomycete cytochrome C